MVPSNFSTSAVKFGCQDWTQAVGTAVPNTKVIRVSVQGVQDKGFIKYAQGFLRVIVLQTLFSPSSIGPTCGDNVIISRVDVACLHFLFSFFSSPSVICKTYKDGKNSVFFPSHSSKGSHIRPEFVCLGKN